MIDISKDKCCGCSSCVNICPKQCIQMKSDIDGFDYPIVNTRNCINCGLCENVCPAINKPNKSKKDSVEACIARHLDENILAYSTSGGFFYGVCQYVINKNGIVYGVTLDEQFEVKHARATSLTECKKFMGSKYVQSSIGSTYCDVKSDLDMGVLVCFSGTPCQVEGLYSFLKGKNYDNLILVDIVCHGVVSGTVWKKYIEYEREKNHKDIQEFQFRSKKYGYQNSTMKICAGDKEFYNTSRTNPYLKIFYSNIALRDSCYNCSSKSINRISDFTIFDSWNAASIIEEKDDDKGYTNVIIQSDKGRTIIQYLKQFMIIKEVNVETIIPKNGGMVTNSARRNPHREDFLNEIREKSFKIAFDKYLPVRKIDYVIEKLKLLLCKSSLLRRLSKIKRNILRRA